MWLIVEVSINKEKGLANAKSLSFDLYFESSINPHYSLKQATNIEYPYLIITFLVTDLPSVFTLIM